MPGIDIGLTVTFLNNATRGLKGLGKDVDDVGKNAQATANRLKAIQVVLAGIIATKVTQFAKAFNDAAAANQNLNLRLEVFAGGAKQAADLQDRLNKKFAASPFLVDDLTGAFIKLQSVFKDSNRSESALSAIANDLSAIKADASASDVDALATALARMGSRGSASMREFQGVAGAAGITMQELAKAAGMTTVEFEGELRQGFMHAGTFIDAFTKASQAKFGDFASNLSSTIGGAFMKLKNDADNALDNLQGRTDINEKLALVWNNVADAVTRFINSIDQNVIDSLFDRIAAIMPIAGHMATSLMHVADILLSLVSISAKLLSVVPAEAREFGIVGYWLFGPAGAAIGIVIGMVDALQQRIFKAGSFLELLAGGAAQLNKMITGNDKGLLSGDASKFKEGLDKLKKTPFTVGGLNDEDNFKDQEALEKAAALVNDMLATLQQIKDSIEISDFDIIGDQLGKSIAEATKKTDAWDAALQNAIDKEKALPKHTEASIAAAAALKQMKEELIPVLARQTAHIREQYEMQTRMLQQEGMILQLEKQREALDLRRSANQDRVFNALSGTRGGSISLGIDGQKLDLLRGVEEAQQSIFELEEKIKSVQADPARVAVLERMKATYLDVQHASIDALEHLSAEGEISKELWKDIGGIIDNDVASGLADVVMHARTLGDVMVQVWNDITRAVVQYLIKLAEAKLMGDSMGAPGGGSGTGILGSIVGAVISSVAGPAGPAVGSLEQLMGMGLAANGRVVPTGVKMFANGGVIQGPTLFGMAGEAGDEAIMPLTRIGGKLGVRSAGSGGDNHYHINISAIDTQTGLQFIEEHIDHIDQQMGHRHRLNRSGRSGNV
jgi:tape measure domain-containing protein